MAFVHRFDVVPGRGGGNTNRYVIACTLKRSQREPRDWSQPGQMLAARLPRDVHELLPYHWRDVADGGPIRAPLMWQVLKDECLKNHGYHRRVDPWNGEVSYVIGCDSGTFLFRQPAAGLTCGTHGT